MTRVIFFLFSALAWASPERTVCLNMIVKNESKIIERCLASVKPLIDYWIIVDTGSEDGTQQIIQNFMQDVPGELYESQWVNFEHNRNEALDLAKGCADYCLFIDADERLIFADDFVPLKLDKDCYVAIVQEASGLKYQRPLLVGTHLDWRWEGVLHEFISTSQPVQAEVLQGVVNYSNTADGARFQNPNKYRLDAQVLEEVLAKDPTHCRYTFYLAQSYANGGEYALALNTYRKRASMGDAHHEVFWSLYLIAQMQKLLHESVDAVEQSLWAAYTFSPLRVEPLVGLVDCAIMKKNIALGYILAKYACSLPQAETIGFMDLSAYDYGRFLQLADCAYLMGQSTEAAQTIGALLANPRLPAQEWARLEQNLSVIQESCQE